MKIAVIDDMKNECELLVSYIQRYCNDNQVALQLQAFQSGEEFFHTFTENAFDIIFIDIYLEGMDGLEIAQCIRKKDNDCILIFSTNSEHHAIKSFRIRAFDYLLKPYFYEQFKETMELCQNKLNEKPRHHYIEVKESRVYVKILINDIIYTDCSNHYILIHTKSRVVKYYMRFSEFSASLLKYPMFLCCYRNCIVNMDHVSFMDKDDFIMETGERIPIARLSRKEIRQRFADYEFEKLTGGL